MTRPALPLDRHRLGRSALGVLVASGMLAVVGLLVLQLAAGFTAATLAPIFLR